MSIVYLDRGEIVSKTGKPIKHDSCLDKYKGQIVELLEKGVQKKEIAQRFGVSKQTLFRFFKLNQIEHSLIYRLNASESKIVEMFKQGITIKQMALCLKTSQRSITQKIKKMKLTRQRSDTYNKPTILENYHTQIKQMFENGFSYQAIAEALGVHVQSIKNCVRQLGLKRNKIGKYASTIVGKEEILLRMHQIGLDTKIIAFVFNCPAQVIRWHLRRLRIASESKRGGENA
mgnify:CR=1 FL=1